MYLFFAVLDENDNAPKFEQSFFQSFLSVKAKRNQFVGTLRGVDLDISDLDNICYRFISGNENQYFSLDSKTGVVKFLNLENLEKNIGKNQIQKNIILNASISDGVYSSYTRFRVNFLPENLNEPRFLNSFSEVHVQENKPSGQLITVVGFQS